jgi:hypothetical protein
MNPLRVDIAKTDRTPSGAPFLGMGRHSGLAS